MTRRTRSSGFTLTELVVVIIIATVLAAFAAARINTTSFDTEGYSNRVTAMVRYAQKVAISQRRSVAVVLVGFPTVTAVRICYTNTSCAGGNVAEPAGNASFQYAPPTNVSLGGTANAGITFDGLGKPYDSAGAALTAAKTITVTGDVTRTITIEPETGYVH